MARRFGKIQQLPSGNFRASFITPDGTRVFAPVTFPTHGDADAWLSTQRTDLIRGTWKAHQTGQARLRDYALTWLASRTDLKPRTAALYQSLLDRHILPTLGDLRLRELTPAIVRDWHTALGRSTGTPPAHRPTDSCAPCATRPSATPSCSPTPARSAEPQPSPLPNEPPPPWPRSTPWPRPFRPGAGGTRPNVRSS